LPMLRRFLKRLATVSPGDGAGLLSLIVLSLFARLALNFAALPKVTSIFLRFRRLPVFPAAHEICRLVDLADLASRITFGRGHCLGRSLLLLWLLQARGEPAELLVGVNKDSRSLQSHAWIRVRETIVGDKPEEIGRFTLVLRLP